MTALLRIEHSIIASCESDKKERLRGEVRRLRRRVPGLVLCHEKLLRYLMVIVQATEENRSPINEYYNVANFHCGMTDEEIVMADDLASRGFDD